MGSDFVINSIRDNLIVGDFLEMAVETRMVKDACLEAQDALDFWPMLFISTVCSPVVTSTKPRLSNR